MGAKLKNKRPKLSTADDKDDLAYLSGVFYAINKSSAASVAAADVYLHADYLAKSVTDMAESGRYVTFAMS